MGTQEARQMAHATDARETGRDARDTSAVCVCARRTVVFCSEFGPVPTSPTPLLQGAPVRLLHPVRRASPRPVVWSVLLLPA